MQQWLEKVFAHSWLRRFILVGYAAKGSLYLLIGVLAVQAALVPSREVAGTYTILKILVHQPLGKVLLCLLAFGLLGYVLRRFIQAAIDPGYSKTFNPKRILHRFGYVTSGISYAGIAYTAVNLALGYGEDDDTLEDLAAQLFEQPQGAWWLLLGGLAVTSVGIAYLQGAYTGSYVSEFQSFDISHRLERWAIAMGKLGVAARGVAFVLIGIFLIQAALFAEPSAAGGLQNAFRLLQTLPLGSLWLGLVGIGFIAYGLYMFVTAKYRRFAVR